MRVFCVVFVFGCLEVPCELEREAPPTVGRADSPRCDKAPAAAVPAPPSNCPSGAPGELTLNELLIDPGGVDVNGDGVASAWDDEFVELVVRADGPRSFGGVQLLVDGNERLTLDDRCLPGGSALVVFGGGAMPAAPPSATEGSSAPVVTYVTARSRLGLSNAGGAIVVVGPDGSFWDEASWEGVEARRSLTRQPELDGAFVEHPGPPDGLSASPGTCADLAPFPSCDAPTPMASAATSCQAVEYGELVVNEFLADPGTFDVNGDGVAEAKGDEFIELMVVSKGPRRLDGVRLVVNGQDRITLYTECLAPGQSVLVIGGPPAPSSVWGDPVVVADRPLGLANSGAQVELWTDIEPLERFLYGQATPGVSLRRQPDGMGDLAPGSPTPGECSVGGPVGLGCERRAE